MEASVKCPADRLRFYRKCFHDLDEQLADLQEEGEERPELLQAEIQCLEELIMLFTDISSMVPSVGSKLPSDQWRPEYVDGLNLSLVTDILMLSATSPWTVYVAERSQWQICYVSPSVKRTFGFRPSDLLGVPAWDGCHPEDIPVLQRMLLLKEVSAATGNALVYRRMRKDRTYLTVQVTGRAIGTRWYAWAEQETSASPTVLSNLRSENGKGAAETSPVSRPRKASATRPTIEAAWSTSMAPSRPASPLAPSRPALKPKVEALDDATSMDADDPKQNSYSEDKAKRIDLQASMPRPKPPTSSSPIAPLSPVPQIDYNVLTGKKVLLVEDDRVNRTIAQKLLESMRCNVTVACNGKEALDILQAAPPATAEEIASGQEIPPQFDLVLMDLLMPVMDGTKAVLHFRDWEALQEPPRKRMTVFALTSNVSDGDMVKCAISGFDEFVSKPLTIEKLVERFKPSS